MIDLSIIIVSYNTQQFLRSCLESIFEKIPKALLFEVIVVDNASKDQSVAMVKREFSKVHVTANKANLGFSKANNIGVSHAKGKYILFLNPDTRFETHEQQTVQHLLDFMNQYSEVGALTCKLVLPNGTIDEACHRGFPTPWNAFCHFSGLSKVFPRMKLFTGYSLEWLDLNTTHEIDACAGAFILVRQKAGEMIGWWDEDYFWYGEDLDFCYRLKQKGWKIYYVPTVRVWHHKGVSGGIKKMSEHITTADRETKIRATEARFEAMKIFYKKYYATKYPKFLTLLVMWGINMKLKFSLLKV